METIELHLDDQTAERLRRLATARQVTLQELLQETIAQLGDITPEGDPLWGLFVEDAELIDQVVEGAMQAREIGYSLRLDNWRT
jgi:predicted transcriptional regulator